jgi:dihydrofolate reductase
MAKLVYSIITSLDGYIADESGNFDWGQPDEEVSTFINDLERDVGTALYGRRMYETMVYWETFDEPDADAYVQDWTGIWRAQSKIVYSTTLTTVSSARTRIERAFIPDDVQKMKDSLESDMSIAGPHLASQAMEAGLVDEMHLFVAPVTVGGGTPAHPGEARTDYELLSVNRFGSGFVHLHYLLDNPTIS